MLSDALFELNIKYNGNIEWKKDPEKVSVKNRGFRISLKVKDSSGIGARRSRNGHKMISACFHAHGDLFDILFNYGANRIVTEYHGRNDMKSKEDNWKDSNIGSRYFALYHSEACDC